MNLNITSSIDGSKLSYATIFNISKNVLQSSDEFGKIALTGEVGDSIRISYVGFENFLVIFSNNEITIKLLPLSNILPLVSISSCKNYNTLVINNFKNDTSKNIFAGFVAGPLAGSNSGKFAMNLRSSIANAYLTKFTFWLKNQAFAPKIAIQNPIIIVFYDVDEATLKPSTPILQNQIIVYPKKTGKILMDLTKLNIRIPENGIYISFQYVIDKKYQYDLLYKPHIDSTAITQILSGGIIVGVRNEPKNIIFYNEPEQKWGAIVKTRSQVKYKLELKYCVD